MSTRCTLHFKSEGRKEPDAIVYRHSDGYPNGESGVKADLKRFFADCLKQCTTNGPRFEQPDYLAAKYIVWQAMENVANSNKWNAEYKTMDGRDRPTIQPLDFLSVAPLMTDPGDIEYWYEIICANKWGSNKPPKVVCHKVR